MDGILVFSGVLKVNVSGEEMRKGVKSPDDLGRSLARDIPVNSSE